jgi:PAS domain S-box-containing protein
VTETINNARANHVSYVAGFRVVRKDGSVRWVNATGTFHYKKNGDPYRMLGVAVDITEHEVVEQTLRESEERFRLVANTAPVMIWMSGTDGRCTYFNKPWLDFTGRPLGAELGNGWAEGILADDRDQCLTTYDEAFASRIPFEMEYRLRRHDGEYRWILDKGVPKFSPDGSFAGYIGSCLDITERKLAEEALASIGSRLIEAHEEERTWIGRELHDDINQRLALLAVELDRFNQQLPSSVEISNMIEQAQQRIAEITGDVQALSHRLHSSKLDYLGLATAANSFCKELSQQSNVRISFEHSGIARDLPREVSLCLFRVLQEALQNAVKHSGVRQFAAELRGSGDNIELSVTDDGRGFKEEEALTHKGIGLISMRERMQMIGGQLSIESRPGAGTTIRASVRVRAGESQAKAS